ncbi:MAG: hypothetical protein ACM3JJ_06400, partial [Hyphomicrobiales bacterium]
DRLDATAVASPAPAPRDVTPPPDAPVPAGSMPVDSGSRTGAPQAIVEEVDVSPEFLPDTAESAPVTDAPESAAPESVASGSAPPETAAPEATSPDDAAPDAPTGDAPHVREHGVFSVSPSHQPGTPRRRAEDGAEGPQGPKDPKEPKDQSINPTSIPLLDGLLPGSNFEP